MKISEKEIIDLVSKKINFREDKLDIGNLLKHQVVFKKYICIKLK